MEGDEESQGQFECDTIKKVPCDRSKHSNQVPCKLDDNNAKRKKRSITINEQSMTVLHKTETTNQWYTRSAHQVHKRSQVI